MEQYDLFQILPWGMVIAASFIYIIKKIIKGLKDEGIDLPKLGEDTADIKEKLIKHLEASELNDAQTSDLHKWHDVDDPKAPGTKIWWGNPALIDMLTRLLKSIDKLDGKIGKLIDFQKDILREMKGK